MHPQSDQHEIEPQLDPTLQKAFAIEIGMTDYRCESNEIAETNLREYFAEVHRSFCIVSAEHRNLFVRFNALPPGLREGDRIGPQVAEDIGEFRQAREYADTFWAPYMIKLEGDILAKKQASFEELELVEDFVRRVRGANAKLARAIKTLEKHAGKET